MLIYNPEANYKHNSVVKSMYKEYKSEKQILQESSFKIFTHNA